MFRPATGPGFGIKELTAETLPELFGVGTVGKAKEERVLATAAQRARPRAERQAFAFAEETDREVAVAEAAVRRERYLMRPLPIHHGFAQLALAVDHARPRLVAARARRYLPRTREGHAFTEPRAALGIWGENKKGTEKSSSLLLDYA
jgi:hypothetical protein